MTGSPTLQKSPQPSHDSNIRPEALKLLEGNIDKHSNASAQQGLSSKDANSKGNNAKNSQTGYAKFSSFYMRKVTIARAGKSLKL